MKTPPARSRVGFVAAIGLFAGVWYGCTDAGPMGPGPEAPEFAASAQGIETALAAQTRHTNELMAIPGVVGTAVGLRPDGTPTVRVLLSRGGVAGIPAHLDGVPVTSTVTGLLVARSDPTDRLRPADIGYSVGHPNITAGSIGGRVVDAAGNVYVLSNNHVLANSNNANIGDATLQPGPFDGGGPGDEIATLYAYKPIMFSANANNTMDAAIALSNTSNVSNSTPLDDGYGMPSSTIYGDGDGDGMIDNVNALLGTPVQKYGRTTRLTTGSITGVNATVSICYEVLIIFCMKSARFVDQVLIDVPGFSDGGDSGSMIVSNDGTNRPVALLFAGSDVSTIANRIDLVLSEFGVSIDAGETPPPDPFTDVSVTSTDAPGFVTQGVAADVDVTVRNTGNQNVGADVQVTLFDETDGVEIGSQTIVGGLTAGASQTLTLQWNTGAASLGDHTLTASHDFADEDASNDASSTTSNVAEPGAAFGIHVGDLTDVFTVVDPDGKTWTATVEVAVHDADHNPINGAYVTGQWSRSGLLVTDACETGSGGGLGTCVISNFYIKGGRNVAFTVTNVSLAGETYEPAQNHDDGGDSDGTTIVVDRPRR